MTRINVGIPPAELTGKHLIAEHREIKRIPNCIKLDVINITLYIDMSLCQKNVS